MERGNESGERLQTEEVEEHSRIERVEEETLELWRMERFSESGEGRQADETQEQGRTDRETSSGQVWQTEEVQEHWRMESVEEEAPDLGRMERVSESEEGSEEGWQAEEAQEQDRWAQEHRIRIQRAAESHERGQVETAQEIEERTELLTAIQMEMGRLYLMLRAEENRRDDRTDENPRIAQNRERILMQIEIQRRRLWDILMLRMTSQGVTPDFVQEVVNDGSRRGALPASRTAVNSLPSISIQKQQQDDGDAICAVCLEVLHCGESAKKLPCSHFYHKDCILRWLQSRNSCPVCRHELPTR